MATEKSKTMTLSKEREKELLIELLTKKLISSDTKATQIIDKTDYVKKLKELHKSLLQQEDFKSGEIVKWKSELKNKKKPEYDQPCIVIEVLENPIKDINMDNSGTSYFNEPLDLCLGLLDEDGEFMTFYYDRRRFTKHK